MYVNAGWGSCLPLQRLMQICTEDEKKGQRRGKYSLKCLDYPVWVALIKIGASLRHYCATNITRGLYAFDLICNNAISGKNTSNLINCIILEHTEPLRLISEAYRLAAVETVKLLT